MDKELYTLCKEVYEKTKWSDTQDVYYQDLKAEYEPFIRPHTDSPSPVYKAVPLYTSDYLLEKLPGQFGNLGSNSVQCLRLCKSNEGFMAGYIGVDLVWWLESIADTPLKALLKLTLALSEEGQL